jgi:hypothetical protein
MVTDVSMFTSWLELKNQLMVMRLNLTHFGVHGGYLISYYLFIKIVTSVDELSILLVMSLNLTHFGVLKKKHTWEEVDHHSQLIYCYCIY